MFKHAFGVLQKVGKALMLPVAVLPVAGLLLSPFLTFPVGPAFHIAVRPRWPGATIHFPITGRAMAHRGILPLTAQATLWLTAPAPGISRLILRP